MIWLKKCLSKITIKNQLFILLLIIFVIVSLFMGGLFDLNSFFAQRLVNEISQSTFSSLNIKELSIEAYFLHYQLNQLFFEKTHVLGFILDAYQFLKLRDSIILDQRLSISLSSINNSSKNAYSNMPYFFSTTLTESDNDQVPELSQILNYLLFNLAIFKQNQMLLLASSDSNQFTAIYPFSDVNETNINHIHETSWYKNHISMISKNSSIPFIKFGPDTELNKHPNMMLSLSLQGASQNIEGIIGITNNIFNLELFDDYDYITILILNQQGRVISSNKQSLLQNSEQQVFIYNTSIIGFDESDWEQIKNQVTSNNGESNCKANTIGFCRYNTLLQQDFNIVTYYDQDDHYFICIKSSKELAKIQSSINQIIDQLQFDLMQLIRLFWIGGIIIIAPMYIFMTIFFSPFKQIQVALASQLNPDTRKYFLKSQSNPKNVFEKLGFANFYKQIESKRKKKSTQCLNLEAFTYPKQPNKGNKILQIMLKNIKKKQMNIVNEQFNNNGQQMINQIFAFQKID